MNILIPKFSMKSRMNTFWAAIVATWIAPYVQHEAQAQAAASVMKMFKTAADVEAFGHVFAAGLFGRELKGAGYAWEGRQALIPDPSGTSPVVTTGANTLNFQAHDFCSIMEIGFIWQVAGTVTALVMDFDKYPGPNGTGTVVDKLDTVNGKITAPTVAGQAIGNVLYKDLGNTLEIDLNKGNSVQAIVTTTTSAGSGIPYVLVVPRAETNANLTTAIASS